MKSRSIINSGGAVSATDLVQCGLCHIAWLHSSRGHVSFVLHVLLDLFFGPGPGPSSQGQDTKEA